jgi:hypothetical protein
MNEDIIAQKLRLLGALDQRERAQRLIERINLEVAEVRGIIAALEHVESKGRETPETEG